MTAPIFFAPAEALRPLAAGSIFVLDGAEGRHAATVKRLDAGERLDLVDGAGLRVHCTVLKSSPGQLELSVESMEREPEPAERLVLVQALAKGDRDELAIETATELGVDGVIPWQSERAIVRWKAERAAKGIAKWESTVTAAAKQARRAVVPAVGGLLDTPALAKEVGAASTVALVLHEDAGQALGEAVREHLSSAEAGRRVLIIVGPEGGISPRELELLTGAGAHPVRLGPHVLRSSTAGPAAVALLSQQLGRWN